MMLENCMWGEDRKLIYRWKTFFIFDYLKTDMSDTINPSYFGTLEKDFSEHLEIPSNKRILFSGKFGKGKTTFLKYFFEKNQEQYFTICLSPVHYSVATNQDIIRYIKYDILIELIKKGYTFERLDINKWQALPFFIAANPEKLISSLLHFIPKVGKTLGELNEKIIAFVKELDKFITENKKKAAGNIIEKYITDIENEEGSIYENDFLTHVINEALEYYTVEKRKPVLIIDDLDRLDPEHIFRILNVFASQFDNYNYNASDKFIFAKTIIVCDVNNIRNIFENRYGKDVDYKGYIDKFFSIEPFNFSNNKSISESVRGFLNDLTITEGSISEKYSNLIGQKPFNINIHYIIEELIKFDFLSLRALNNYFPNQKIIVPTGFLFRGKAISTHSSNIVLEFKILNSLLGGYKKLANAINHLALANVNTANIFSFGKLLHFYLATEKCQNNRGLDDTSKSPELELGGYIVRYKIEKSEIIVERRYDNTGFAPFQPDSKTLYYLILLYANELYNNQEIE
jgi:hypothetical protein